MIISTIVQVITGVFKGGRGEGPAASESLLAKRWRDLEKMVKQATRCTQKTCWKDRWNISRYRGSVIDTVLSFLRKADGLVTEHIWDLSAFVAGLIGLWLMQKVKNQKKS